MAKTKTTKTVKPGKKARTRSVTATQEADSIYFLKLVLYLILGSQWLRITKGTVTVPLPIGLLIGLLFARTERLRVDRKIELAILLLSTFISFWLPIGLELTL